MLTRTQKQLVIGGIYIIIAAIISGGIYWSKYRPTCSDGLKNGREEGVDCGTLACGKECAAPVQPLVVQDVQLARTPAGDYDMSALVYNPNVEYGASVVNYELVMTGTSAEVRREGTFYILPGQTKYLVRTSMRDVPDSPRASIEIKSAEWIKTSGAPETYFAIDREAYAPGAAQSAYEVAIENVSNYDFDAVDVSVVVMDNNGKLLTTNTSNLRTFLSQTERSLKVSWPFALPAESRIRVEIGTNIFNDSNYIQRNGTQEKFQQYY